MKLSEDTSDEDLVNQIINKNKELFYHLVVRYEAKLKRYILTITNRRNEVDDVVQNVFLKAYTNLRTFDRRLKFSSWLYRIAHNESVNLISSGFIQKFLSLPDWLDIESRDRIEERMDEEAMKQRLKKCIDKLKMKYKEPLVLFYYDDKSYAEISDILRIPVRNVGVLIHRGKLQVKELCNEKNNS